MAGYDLDPQVLQQFIKESGLKYTQTARSWVFECPRCRSAKKLYISKTSGRFVCFKCRETSRYQGRPEYALQDLLNAPLKQIRNRLYGGSAIHVELWLDIHLRDFFDDDDEPQDIRVLEPVDWPHDYLPIQDPHARRGAEYLQGRGVAVELATQYGIMYCPQRRRVAFPVASGGVLYGWQGRLIIPTTHVDPDGNQVELNKIESNPGIPRDRTLMFADRLTGSSHAILTEGPVDALKCHYLGGNVCAMGKAVTPEQMKLLLYAGVQRLYLGLDPDAAEETMRLVRDHFGDVELFNLQAPGAGKVDLGGMTFEDVGELFRGARRIEAGQIFIYLKPIA